MAPSSSTGSAVVSTAKTLEDYNLGRLPNSCGTGNRAPVANAGPDQTVALLAAVTLNGSGSSDPDGNALTFTWSFISRPLSSAATLSDVHAVMPTFVADVLSQQASGERGSDKAASVNRAAATPSMRTIPRQTQAPAPCQKLVNRG